MEALLYFDETQNVNVKVLCNKNTHNICNNCNKSIEFYIMEILHYRNRIWE